MINGDLMMLMMINDGEYLLLGGAITNHLEKWWSESQWGLDDNPY